MNDKEIIKGGVVKIKESKNFSKWLWNLEGKVLKKFKRKIIGRNPNDVYAENIIVGYETLIHIRFQGKVWDNTEKHPADSGEFILKESDVILLK